MPPKSRATRASASTGLGLSYAETGDEDEFGFATVGFDQEEEEEDEDEDPMGTAELKRVIRSFGKRGAKQDNTAARKLSVQVDQCLKSKGGEMDKVVKRGLGEIDTYISSLNLDSPSPPPSARRDLFAAPSALLELTAKQELETASQLSLVDEILLELSPECNTFYEEAKIALHSRAKLARKQYKKLKKQAEGEWEEQRSMAEMYQALAPTIVKGFKMAMS